MKVFSFCLYGDKKKYCQGMLENLKIIAGKFSEFETWIYMAPDVPTDYIEQYKTYKVNIIQVDKIEGMMIRRFFPIDNKNVEIMFSRDADSRINDRDEWCIKEFLSSEKQFHVIRDNFWHKSYKAGGGLSGIKQNNMTEKIEDLYNAFLENNTERINNYGIDEEFLNLTVYPMFENSVLIHSDIIAFEHESVIPINIYNDGFNFVGNVYEYNEIGEYPSFNYFKQLKDNIVALMEWLRYQKSWNNIIYIFNECLNLDELASQNISSQNMSSQNISSQNMSSQNIYKVLDDVYMAYYYTNNLKKCQDVLKLFDKTHVNEHIINNSNFLINRLRESGYKIIGTTFIDREPNDNEIVIIYGNFHHCVDNLPWSNKLYRHSIYSKDVVHDKWEYDECWKNIDQIYILNLEERKDRFMEIMVELSRLNAPLNKIYHYKAQKEQITGIKNTDVNLGALKNHMEAVEHFLNNEYTSVLILEDDVTITPRIDKHKKDLTEFFSRNYDYDICMITGSKYWKIVPYDDLLNLSYQICTTSSGYILSRQGAEKILPLFKYSYEVMKKTHDTIKYAIDRYWSLIQKDNKFFVFKDKFGYQRCNYSSITGRIDCHFD